MMLIVGARTVFLVLAGNRSAAERRRLMGPFGKAVGCLVAAYTVWDIDLEKCLELRRLKDRLGLPSSWLVGLHGWWHVLTALGASMCIRLI
jgi:dihydroceramidase